MKRYKNVGDKVKNLQKTESRYNIYEALFANSLIVFMFSSLFFSGLYTERTYTVFGILFGSYFLGLYWHNNYKTRVNILTYLLVFFIVSSVISTLNAADIRYHFLSINKNILYLLVFTATLIILQKEKYIVRILYGFFLSVSFISISTIFETLRIEHISRFSSTLGYANTYGIILVVAIIISLYLILYAKTKNSIVNYLIEYLIVINIICLVGTQSRGAILVYVVSLLLNIIFNEKITRQKIIKNTLLYNFIALFISSVAYSLNGVMFCITAILLPIGFFLTISFLRKRNVVLKKSHKYFLILFVVLIVAVSLLSRHSFLIRFKNLNFADADVFSRAVFYKDGLNIFRDYPIFGAGGGGWQALYTKYQGHAYNTLETHSFFIQSLVENGIIGTLFLTLFFVGSLFVYIRKRINIGSQWFETVSIICILAIVTHSFIDFNLSFPGVNILLFTLVAITTCKSYNNMCVSKKTRYTGYIILFYSLILIISFSSVALGKIISNDAVKAMESERGLTLEQAKSYQSKLESALNFDPLNSEYTGYLGQICVNLGRANNDDLLFQQGIDYIDKTIALQPHRFNVHIVRGQTFDSFGNIPESLISFENAIATAPLKNNGFDFLVAKKFDIATEKRIAANYYEIIEIVEDLRKKMFEIPPERKNIWIGDYLGYSFQLCYYAGQASYYLEDYSAGILYFSEALKSQDTFLVNDMEEEVKAWIKIGEEMVANHQVPNELVEEVNVQTILEKLNKYSVNNELLIIN